MVDHFAIIAERINVYTVRDYASMAKLPRLARRR